MIQEKPSFTIQADDNMTSSQFTLKQENLAHVFDILRNNLYSDKILACIREYSTNALDANKENGNEHIPIDITLPTVIEPVFMVRDYGSGLSEHDIFEVYSSYGASTKRASNDYVGTLGMGSKSAFGYAESFTITSYHGGYKKVYEAYIDESKIGTITKVYEEISNEPTGICVTISVKSKDISTFKATAIKFFTWFEPTPRFFGVNIKHDIDNFIADVKVYHKSETCTLYRKGYTTKSVSVKMGNIVYPVNNQADIDISWLTYYDHLIINVNIGDVSFTTSRESLEMTTKTIALINQKIIQIKSELTKTWQSDIDKCNTIWDALCHYYELAELPRNILQNNLIWRGKKVDTTFINKLEWTNYNERSRQWQKAYSVSFVKTDKIALIIDDGGYPTSQTRSRLMEARSILLAESKWNRILFGKGTKEQSLALLAMEEIQGARVIKLSSISKPASKNTKSNHGKDTVFEWNGGSYFPYSSCWDSKTVDPDVKKVYVMIDSYKPSHGFDTLKWVQRYFKMRGKDITIYGVKKATSLDSSWISLQEFLSQYVDEIIADKEFLKIYKEYRVAGEIMNHNVFSQNVQKGFYDQLEGDITCPIVKKIVKMPRANKSNLPDNFSKDLEFITWWMKGYFALNSNIDTLNSDIKSLVNSYRADLEYVSTNYPLVLDYYHYYSSQGDKAKQHIHYINLVHQANAKASSRKSFAA